MFVSIVPFAPSVAASGLCGTTIIASIELDQDLTCTGDGITIGADGVRVDLNGHTITGPNTDPSVGVRVEGRHDVVITGEGTVRDFQTGILVKGSTDVTVKEVTAFHNGHANAAVGLVSSAGIAIVTSSNIRVKENTALHNGNAGIVLSESTNVRVKENVAGESHHDGIFLRLSDHNVIVENLMVRNTAANGCGINLVGSNFNVIKENRIEDTGLSAIRLNGASNNAIGENEIARFLHGVHALSGSTGNLATENEIADGTNAISFVGPEALGNTYRENDIARNACGVTGSATELAGNTFLENEFEANVQDICAE